MSAAAAATGFADEAALGRLWAAGARGPLRLADGRALRIIFPGVPGGASGPDFRGAIVDAAGDLLRGDVELHLRASGWRAHGHHRDPAYAAVVLHVVAENDSGAMATLHSSGRAVPVLVLSAAAGGQALFPPPFTPPCAFAVASGRDPAAVLERLSLRRLRMKAARAVPLLAASGAGQTLYTLALEQLAGSANRGAFAALARRLPLAPLLEAAEMALDGTPRTLAFTAALRAAAAPLALRRAGLRPLAAPGKRLEAAAALFAGWWPAGSAPVWPLALVPPDAMPRPLPTGVGRSTAIELAANAVLPLALAARRWPEADIESAWLALPSPGIYGKLRPLGGWLSTGPSTAPTPREKATEVAVRRTPRTPFGTAARLQGALLLHTDYCTKGACGRCPLSSPQS